MAKMSLPRPPVIALTAAVSSAFNPDRTSFPAAYAASPSDVWTGARVNIERPYQVNVLPHWDGTAQATMPAGPQEYGLPYGNDSDGDPGGIWTLDGNGRGDLRAARHGAYRRQTGAAGRPPALQHWQQPCVSSEGKDQSCAS
jgi:hypothetical protein